MSLPRYVWEKGEYQETANKCYPEGKRDWYREYLNSQPRPHYYQYPSQGKNGSRGTNSYRKGWPQKYVEDIPQYAPYEVYDEEFLLSK